MGRLPLTEDDTTAYRLIAEGQPPPDTYDVGRLVALGLVDPAPYVPGGYIPHDPRATAQGIAAGLLRDLTALGQLERLAQHFDPHRLFGGPASEFLPTSAAMNARLGEVGGAASTEFCSFQPAPPADRDPAILQLGVERTRAALHRGVHVRALYHRSTHEHDQARDYVDRMVADGAEVRASTIPGLRMVIIDRKHLFIDNHVIEEAETNSGWHVSDRAAVAWAFAVFELFWGMAERWQDLGRAAAPSPLTERQKHILRLLSVGRSQQQIAARIGLSGRAVAKELHRVRTTLGFETTAEMMHWHGRTHGGTQDSAP
ncbi:LuxR C-terminal-related transcriptional regulator [Streptomyces sp. NPDC060286]|uniref:helix-turn-helix transcriptional regulator n=1 Tax=unclassified Streptomyces TaxID=2593676 RepID=UPI0035D88CB6